MRLKFRHWLNSTEHSDIVNALRYAADHYECHAKVMQDVADNVTLDDDSGITTEGAKRLAAQFRRQMTRSRRLAERLERSFEITYDSEELRCGCAPDGSDPCSVWPECKGPPEV